MNDPIFWDKLARDLRRALNQDGLEVTVAGGAVRDYFFGVEPNDIDIFVRTRRLDDYPTPEGWTFVRQLGQAEYPGGALQAVMEYTVEDMTVQVMYLTGNFFNHFITFDNNLTKAHWTAPGVWGQGNMVLSNEFLAGVHRNEIWAMGAVDARVQQRMQAQVDRLGLRGIIDNPLAPRVVDDRIGGVRRVEAINLQ